MGRMNKFLLPGLSVLMLALAGCQTDKQEVEKPTITRDMDLGEAYGYARTFGEDTMQRVKDLAKDRQELPKLSRLTETDLTTNNEKLTYAELGHAANMYVYSNQRIDPKVIRSLLVSRSPWTRKIGWRLSAVKPSAEISTVIDNVLNRALNDNREDEILDPEMAKALQENQMKGSFTFLVRGLDLQGSPEYAQAMLILNPKGAVNPFFNYLMKADLEDLRQLNQKSVNVYTCTVIFRFLMENPIPVTHPGVPSLFLFAVSRNRGLADMANTVLEKHIPENRAAFAAMLARLPVPVQVAFIENSQREMTANLRLLLNDLKDVAQQKEVIDELNAPQESGAQ